MVIRLDTHSGVPIYRQIFTQIRRQILAGRLAPEDKLPSVRDLSAELHVNPMTVSKTYALLERDDLVIRRRGVGLFVAEISTHDSIREREALLVEALARVVSLARQLGIGSARCESLLRERFESNGIASEESRS